MLKGMQIITFRRSKYLLLTLLNDATSAAKKKPVRTNYMLKH